MSTAQARHDGGQHSGAAAVTERCPAVAVVDSPGDDLVTGADVPQLEVAPRAGRRTRLLVVSSAVVIGLVVAVAGVALANAGEIAAGTRVLGVDVGRKTRADAVRMLRDRLASRVAATVPVRVGSTPAEIKPADAGLTLDFEATVAAAAKPSGSLWSLFGRRDVAPVVTVDADRLHAALAPHVGGQAVPWTGPAIRYDKLNPTPVYPRPGRGVDRRQAAKIFGDAWLRRPSVEVPITDLSPVTTGEDVDRIVRDLATPAVSAPVTVSLPTGEIEIPPAAIAASLLLESDEDGRISPRMDQAKLRLALVDRIKPFETPAKNASITISGGQPVVTPHVDGRSVDIAALARDLPPVLGQPAPRRVTANLMVAPPQLTADAVAGLGIKEKISSFTTNFVAGQSRTTNIKKVADVVRGTLVRAGETFSLNAATGERTLAKGYVPAPVIDGSGKLKNAPGGGISQVATTLFNASYYAGLEDVAHQPHSYYFSRYPPVIEATTVYPHLDLKFRNDSPTGVLIDTSYTSTSLTVTLWGTKRYDVETVWGPRTDVVAPKTVYLDEPDCTATAGIPGFRQEAWRVFKQNGKEIKRQRFSWRYDAEPRFICGKPPA